MQQPLKLLYLGIIILYIYSVLPAFNEDPSIIEASLFELDNIID